MRCFCRRGSGGGKRLPRGGTCQVIRLGSDPLSPRKRKTRALCHGETDFSLSSPRFSTVFSLLFFPFPLFFSLFRQTQWPNERSKEHDEVKRYSPISVQTSTILARRDDRATRKPFDAAFSFSSCSFLLIKVLIIFNRPMFDSLIQLRGKYVYFASLSSSNRGKTFHSSQAFLISAPFKKHR